MTERSFIKMLDSTTNMAYTIHQHDNFSGKHEFERNVAINVESAIDVIVYKRAYTLDEGGQSPVQLANKLSNSGRQGNML